MLPCGGTRGEAGLGGAAPEVVHRDIAIIQTHNNLDREVITSKHGTGDRFYHIWMTWMDIEGNNARASFANILWIGGIL